MTSTDQRCRWRVVASTVALALLSTNVPTFAADNGDSVDAGSKTPKDTKSEPPPEAQTQPAPAQGSSSPPSFESPPPSSHPSSTPNASSTQPSAPASHSAQPGAMPAAGIKLEEVISARYLECHEAFANAKTFEELKPYQSKKVRDDLESRLEKLPKDGDAEKNKKVLQALFELMRGMVPRKVKVTKVLVKDDKAEITATSTDPGALGDAIGKGFSQLITSTTGATKQPQMYTKADGKINMVKEDGQWMMESESWNSKSSNLSPAQEAKKKVVSDWCAQAATLPFPKKPAAGMIHGQPFKVERAEMSKNFILKLRQGNGFFADREVSLFIFDMTGVPDGQQVIEKDGNHTTKAHCHVHYSYKTAAGDHPGKYETFMGMDAFGLRLVFGKRANGKLPGYIMLRLPDKEKSFVEGYFYLPADG